MVIAHRRWLTRLVIFYEQSMLYVYLKESLYFKVRKGVTI
nr:MAG TPA: hypothetical protein [Caudoviricetes sp.]